MKKTNSMYFEHLEDAVNFIKTLHKLSLKDSDYYNDIHTYEEEGAIIVEWEQSPYDKSYGGTFQYIGEDEVVMLERGFPDDHTQYFFSEEEYQEALKEWLEENKGWKRNQYGRWYREEIEEEG